MSAAARRLAVGISGEAGQRNVFLVCAGALYLYGFLSLGLDATKPVLKPVTQKLE